MSTHQIIEVLRASRVCSRCAGMGHNRNDIDENGQHVCLSYEILGGSYYSQLLPCMETCTRCNQPGHRRSNRQRCTLASSHPDYYRDPSRRPRQPRETREPLDQPAVQPQPSQPPQQPYTRQEIIMKFNRMFIYTLRALDVCEQHNITTSGRRVSFLRFVNNILYQASNRVRIQMVDIHSDYIVKMYNKVFRICSDTSLFTDREIASILNPMGIIPLLAQQPLPIPPTIQELLLIVPPPVVTPKRALKIITAIPDNSLNVFECVICFDDKMRVDICETNCKHNLCVGCMCGLIKSRKGKTLLPCPMCRSDVLEVTAVGEKNITDIQQAL